MMLASLQNILFLLGSFFFLSTLDQGPTYVLAVNVKEGSDPLYEYPRDQVGRKRAQSPSLPTIPEEGNGPPRRDGWDQIRENPNIVGMGPPPLSGFFFQPRQPVRGPAPRHLPPGPQPLGPPLPGLPGPRLPVPPPLGPPPPGAPPPVPPPVAPPVPPPRAPPPHVPPPAGAQPRPANRRRADRLRDMLHRLFPRQG
uniref:Uncharacterized protein n=1 Tax=Rhipicephalus appendiculatus TaxID=34631 RepID=A0A131YCC4_RHIAP